MCDAPMRLAQRNHYAVDLTQARRRSGWSGYSHCSAVPPSVLTPSRCKSSSVCQQQVPHPPYLPCGHCTLFTLFHMR